MSERSLFAGFITALAALLFLLERRWPLRSPRRPLLRRLLVNGLFAALTALAVYLIVRPAAEATLAWTAQRPFGLVHLFGLPPAGEAVAAFFLMDLTFYWWHRANHRLPILWRFHNVHHFDPDLDVSTAFRFHFGEILFSTGFRVLQVGLIGISAWTYALYEIAFQAGTLFHHSNLRLPHRVERLLVLLLVTPRMHGIHHSRVRSETNSNYSTLFSFWDRLHRSLGLNIPQGEIEIGVPGYAKPEDNEWRQALAAPFRSQRDYWPQEDDASLRPLSTTRGRLAP